MDHRYQSRPAPKEPRVRGGAWALLFGGLSVYNLIRAFFPRTEAELDYWWTFLLTSLIFLGIALTFFFLRRKDLAAHRRWQQDLAAWRQDQIDLENQHHAQEMERLNRQLELEKAELARIRAQAAAERREQPRPDQEKEEYKVAGTSYRQDAFEKIGIANPDYSLTKQEILSAGREGEHFDKYLFDPLPAALAKDPDNSHGTHAVKVLLGGEHVGYIPSDFSEHVTRLMDNGQITEIDAEVVGGPYKYVDLDEDAIVKENLNFGVRLTIYVKQ